MDQKPKFSKVLAEFLFTPGFAIIIAIVALVILAGIITVVKGVFGENALYLLGLLVCIGLLVYGIYGRLSQNGTIPEFKTGKQRAADIEQQILADRYKEKEALKEQMIQKGVEKAVEEYRKKMLEWAIDKPDPADIPDNVDEDGYFYMTDDEWKEIGQMPKRRGK